MGRSATSRLKVNPPLGRMPVLQFVPPAELQVDASYQRSIEGADSQGLIRKIAQHWNWDICQPLVVSRRSWMDGALFVIDGQHRLSAARLRKDIAQLPCVVLDYASAADEAANFVHLNRQRRQLSKLDLFKAAVASEDPEACAILEAIEGSGLSVAPHLTSVAWKPGMVGNIGGIERAWRRQGAGVTKTALAVLAQAFKGQVLQYAGTLFPGVVALCMAARGDHVPDAELAEWLGSRSQKDWRGAMMEARVADPNLKYSAASEQAILSAWRAHRGEPVDAGAGRLRFTPDANGKDWCEQCEMRVTRAEAEGCKSRWCSLKVAA